MELFNLGVCPQADSVAVPIKDSYYELVLEPLGKMYSGFPLAAIWWGGFFLF